MRFSYHSDTDSLYIHLSEQPGADVHDVTDEIVLDLNEAGQLVGIEVQNASRHIDLSVLEDMHASSTPSGLALTCRLYAVICGSAKRKVDAV